MEKLFLKYIDGKIQGHPVLQSNLQLLYPDVDCEVEIPANWILFTRVAEPNIDRTRYLPVYNGYKVIDGIGYDDWILEDAPNWDVPEDSISTPDEI